MRSVKSVALATIFVALAFAGAAQGDTLCADLSTAAATGTCGLASFQQIIPRSTGSGVIHSFVRVDGSGSPTLAAIEQGFNTDARPYAANNDAQTTATFDHSVLVANVPVYHTGDTIEGFTLTGDPGQAYLQFVLDVNQSKSDNPAFLSLDQLTVWLAPTADLNPAISLSSDVPTAPNFGATASQIYNLDTGTNNYILLNYALNTGSGSGDMFAYIPISAAQLANAGGAFTYVYLYSAFGIQGNCTSSTTDISAPCVNNDGYEEWSHLDQENPPPPIPEPASLVLLGTGLLGVVAKVRSRRK